MNKSWLLLSYIHTLFSLPSQSVDGRLQSLSHWFITMGWMWLSVFAHRTVSYDYSVNSAIRLLSCLHVNIVHNNMDKYLSHLVEHWTWFNIQFCLMSWGEFILQEQQK